MGLWISFTIYWFVIFIKGKECIEFSDEWKIIFYSGFDELCNVIQ